MLATCSYSPPTGNVHCHEVWTYFWIQPGTLPAPALAIQSCHGLLTWIIGVFSEIDHQAMIAITDHYSNGQYCCRLPGLHSQSWYPSIAVLPLIAQSDIFWPYSIVGARVSSQKWEAALGAVCAQTFMGRRDHAAVLEAQDFQHQWTRAAAQGESAVGIFWCGQVALPPIPTHWSWNSIITGWWF